MPQLDLDSIFFVGVGVSSSKVACDFEAVALPGGSDAHADGRIRTLGGIGWAWPGLPRAALERDGSTKGTSNPKAAAAASRQRRLPAGKTKTATAIAVLAAGGKLIFAEQRPPVPVRGWRRPAAGARVFASEATEAEPVSPKVNCFGAVRPESRAAAATPPPWGEEEQEVECWRPCWASVTAALHHLCASENRCEDESRASESDDTTSEPPAVAVHSPPLPPPLPVPGLGDVKRLASRRWPEGLPV